MIDLAAWRQAAIRGDLPTPARADRWQPMRAGVVNLWEYDIAEVWYADGRMQLQGANESGKSTLMTLTTLLLLAGNVSSYNIDTLGSSSKQFRYYVEPTNHPLDRRDTGQQKHRGWAWVEYGRVGPGGPEFFTTLLFAETRRADTKRPIRWCTLRGNRVRAGLSLINSSFVAEPNHLHDISGLTPHPSATAYREEVARVLFDSDVHWLDQVIRILRVVRTPKIGDQLNVRFLTDAFRAALPPLADDEIRQLADGWEQLERMRNERDTTEQALAAVSEFSRQRWRPWADAVIRAAADPVIRATSELTTITRQETAAKEKVDQAGQEVESAERDIAQLKSKLDTATDARDALRDRQAYKDAVAAVANAQQLEGNARQLDQLAERSALHASKALAAIEPAETRVSQAAAAVRKAETSVDDAADHIARNADISGLIDATARFLPGRDAARLRQAAEQRQQHAKHAIRLLELQATAVGRHDGAVAEAQRVRGESDQAKKVADEIATALEHAVTAVGELLEEWAANLDQRVRPPRTLLEEWAGQVSRIADAGEPAPVLAAAAARDHLIPTRRPFESRKAAIGRLVEENVASQKVAGEQLAAVEAETDPRPAEPFLWLRRERPDGVTDLGAPLWRLVETVDDAPVGPLEAALEASGLLQAWVTADGAYVPDRDGNDTIWPAPPEPYGEGGTLRTVLRPAEDAGALSSCVDRLLRTVRYGQSLPEDVALAVATDGRWRQGGLTGAAATPSTGARLLGAAARAADRARRSAELTGRLDALARDEEELRHQLREVEDLLAALDAAAEQLPSDSLVISNALALRQASNRAVALESAAAKADAVEQEAARAADQATAEVSAYAQTHQLAHSRAGVDAVLAGLIDYLGAVRDLVSALKLVPPLSDAAGQAAETLNDCRTALEQANNDAAEDRAKADRSRAKAAAAKSALSQGGRELLTRYDELSKYIAEFEPRLTALNDALRLTVDGRARAEVILEQAAERRQEAEKSRQRAVDEWFGCVEVGLPRLRDLEAPAARHVTAALESARTARARISIRDWPEEDSSAAAHRVQTLWSRMVDAVTTLRSRLESLGGRTARTVLPGDGDESFPGAVEVIVDGTGVAQEPPAAAGTLGSLLEKLRTEYDEELTRTINQLLGSTFIEHLRDRLIEAERLRTNINVKLEQNPTSTSGLMLRLVREAVADEHAANQVLTALEHSYNLLSEPTQEQVRGFLANRVNDAQEAARAAGDPDWRARLAEILDYRRWFELKLEYRAAKRDGTTVNWRRLDRDDHSLLSGGAKVVTLLQPFVAALHAMYDQSGVGPRMMWLDEAFDGVDTENRATMLRLLTSCDLDWLIAGPGPIVNATTVPMAALYEVRRAPRPHPGVSLELAVWSGKELTHVVTPDPADLPSHGVPGPPDLFS